MAYLRNGNNNGQAMHGYAWRLGHHLAPANNIKIVLPGEETVEQVPEKEAKASNWDSVFYISYLLFEVKE